MSWATYCDPVMYQIVKQRMRSFERVPGSPIFEQESEALAWAQQYIEAHRGTLDHARERVGVVREADFSSFNAVI